ncbi:Exosome complex component RRP43 [Camellia lanceoleosa]|uniref:Exosome complex component RRP43 n=1 Tax=Camellia lanceoleosa TaxID=1840588 RepID=A0ACC0G8Q0_9ERIC|nr:Exosome complex component RRP43 [Camellia lanceoleosa]
MSSTNASSDLSSEMEVDAFRRLFPLRFHERHLLESTCPDAKNLGKARDTTLALGTVASADGSDLAKIGCTTTLAAIKMEVMTPTIESPDEGCIAIDFQMHPICSPIVRPGRPADAAPVISKQLSDTILSSGMIYFKELSLVNGKAAWIAYLDIYCLDADGTLFDDALLAAVAAFSHLQIPVVSLNGDGRVVVVSEKDGGKLKCEPINKGKRKLKLSSVSFSLTCILHKNYMLADLTAEEESIMKTLVTVDCIALTRQRVKELQKVLNEAIFEIEGD